MIITAISFFFIFISTLTANILVAQKFKKVKSDYDLTYKTTGDRYNILLENVISLKKENKSLGLIKQNFYKSESKFKEEIISLQAKVSQIQHKFYESEFRVEKLKIENDGLFQEKKLLENRLNNNKEKKEPLITLTGIPKQYSFENDTTVLRVLSKSYNVTKDYTNINWHLIPINMEYLIAFISSTTYRFIDDGVIFSRKDMYFKENKIGILFMAYFEKEESLTPIFIDKTDSFSTLLNLLDLVTNLKHSIDFSMHPELKKVFLARYNHLPSIYLQYEK